MKVAIVSSGFFPVIDGVTITVFNRLQKLSQDGHQVLLFCPDYSSLETIYPDWQNYVGDILPGIKVVSLPSTAFMDLDFERNFSRKAYSMLLQQLEQFQPDIIHVDEPDRLFLGFIKAPGIDFAKRNEIPCIGFFHTNFIDYIDDYFSLPGWAIAVFKRISQAIISRTYNAYTVTLTASPISYQKLVDMGIKNVVCDDLLGVDLKKFHPELRVPNFFEQQYGLLDLEQKQKLIFLGRLTPDKGWNFTLNAFSKLAQAVNLQNIAIFIVGDGPMQNEIASKLGKLAPHVHLLGRVPPDNVPALLANSNIHITTSEKETKGLTLLEAFASGIPVIAPRAGGVIDSVQEGRNGLLFEPRNVDDFVNKLKQLIDNPDLQREMGNSGREYVSQHSWDNAIEQLVKIWQAQLDLKKIKKKV